MIYVLMTVAMMAPPQAPPIVVPQISVQNARGSATVYADGATVVEVRRGLFRRPAYVTIAPVAVVGPTKPKVVPPPPAKQAPTLQYRIPRRVRGGNC